jgi:DNA-binding GntR family transcriptional regulator
MQSTLTQGEAANILRLEPGSPILKIAIALYDRDNRPLVSGQSFYNDAALRLRLVQVWE